MSGNNRADVEHQLVVVCSFVTADGTDRTYRDVLGVNCLKPLVGGMQATNVFQNNWSNITSFQLVGVRWPGLLSLIKARRTRDIFAFGSVYRSS